MRAAIRTTSQFQGLMRRTYLRRDRERGVLGTLLWMISETGEFAGAVLKEEQMKMADEAADVYAWLCSTCNLLGINLEKVSFEKYGKGCPRCHHSPCECKDK